MERNSEVVGRPDHAGLQVFSREQFRAVFDDASNGSGRFVEAKRSGE